MPASTMTLKNVRDEVIFATGRKDINDIIDKNTRAAIVELVYKLRLREFHKTRTFNTAADTEGYAILSDEFALLTLRDNTNGVPITRREITQRDEIDLTETNAPTHYCEWDEEILLFDGVPDGVYEIEVKSLMRPTLPAADGTAIPLPEEWDEAVRLLSLAKTLANPLRKWEEAQAAKAEVASVIQGRTHPEGESQEHTGDQYFVFSDFTAK